MATVTVEVTQEDIDEGSINCEWCPIALALKRRFGIMPRIRVSENYIHIDEAMIPTPDEAAEFILDFDTERVVVPISFPLDIPDDLLATVPT